MSVHGRIYEVVRQIPRGNVLSYGDVARLSGTHPRVVGWALHRNHDPKNIPCHRVVFRDGSLSPGYAFGGASKQREILEKEGVVFIGDKVIIR